MGYTITGIPMENLIPLKGQTNDQLKEQGVERIIASNKPGFPCRITLEDAEPGEPMLLMNYVSHAVTSPYRNAYAIYMREGATAEARFKNQLAPALMGRPISLRMFDHAGQLVGADLDIDGTLDQKIERAFDRSEVSYLHAHNAAHGCFAAEILRA